MIRFASIMLALCLFSTANAQCNATWVQDKIDLAGGYLDNGDSYLVTAVTRDMLVLNNISPAIWSLMDGWADDGCWDLYYSYFEIVLEIDYNAQTNSNLCDAKAQEILACRNALADLQADLAAWDGTQASMNALCQRATDLASEAIQLATDAAGLKQFATQNHILATDTLQQAMNEVCDPNGGGGGGGGYPYHEQSLTASNK